MAPELTEPRPAFLSTLPPGRGDRRSALIVVAVSIALFAAVAPFARVQLAPVWAFIPAYQSALVVNDVITAVLLFGQFALLRSRGLLLLAGAYLFTAFIAISHALSFPGLFSPPGLLGAGPQSTAWLYMFWHGFFPLCIVAYAIMGDRSGRPIAPPAIRVAIVATVASALAAACGLAYVATAGQASLPPIMQNNAYAPAMTGVVFGGGDARRCSIYG